MSYKDVAELKRINQMSDQETFNYLGLSNYTKLCECCDDIFQTSYSTCPKCGGHLYELSHKELRPYYLKRIDNFRENNNKEINRQAPYSSISNQHTTPKLVPKCPLCQSPKIRQISTVKRGVFGMAFGLLSTTARSQWECLNCGNKF